MGTKMKGLLRGLRYISQIFDDEEDKQPEMQIGYPTDVKHVAHIGWNGPTVDPPSWMKDFKEPPAGQSAPTGSSGESRQTQETQRASEGSRGGSKPSRLQLQNCPSKGLTDQTTSRDLLLAKGSPSSCPLQPQEEPPSSSTKPKRNSSSSSSSTKSTRKSKDKDSGPVPGPGSDSPSRSLPEIPKKLRRKKKPKEESESGSSRSSRTKGGGVPAPVTLYSDPGPDTEPISGSDNGQFARNASLRPFRKEGRQ